MTDKIYNCLWFATDAEAAVDRFIAIFGGRVLRVARNGRAGAGPEGSVLTVDFEILGRRFLALNGNQPREYTDAMSLVVECDSQAEIDRYWSALIEDGGRAVACGWLNDRWGIRWQIVPRSLIEHIAGPHADAVMAEVMKMVKLDKATLDAAAAGGASE